MLKCRSRELDGDNSFVCAVLRRVGRSDISGSKARTVNIGFDRDITDCLKEGAKKQMMNRNDTTRLRRTGGNNSSERRRFIICFPLRPAYSGRSISVDSLIASIDIGDTQNLILSFFRFSTDG